MRAGGTAAGSEGGKGQGRQSPSRWAGGSERQRPAGGAPLPFIMYPSEAAGDRRGAGAHGEQQRWSDERGGSTPTLLVRTASGVGGRLPPPSHQC